MNVAYERAKKEIGQSEVSGNKHNPRIIEYHSVTSLRATTDEVPWCSAFVSWCLEQAGMKSTRSAWAKSYLSYGKETKEPKEGDIVVFSRGKNSGHVGFFVKRDLLTVTVLGGNQDNRVNYKKYLRARVLGYRIPVGK